MDNENANLNTEEVVSPQKIEEMDEEVFKAYIESAKQADGEVQAVTDTGDAEPANDNAENEPYMSFKTKEELQEYQNRTIGTRLKEIREAGEGDKKYLENISNLAKSRFNTEDDVAAITKLMEELELQNMDNKNMNSDEYSVTQELKAYRDEINYRRQIDDIQNEWTRQGEALKKIVPDFDLEKAFENPEFYQRVVDGHETLAEAYPVLKKKMPRRAISEIGNSTNGVAGHINHDVKSMSDKDFDEYIKKIKNG